LSVDSLAFRAWNRGLAATSPLGGAATTAFGVWLFNGTRWFPDPTFPGQAVCKGNTVLWAGKRDYWLVGRRASSWPSLCRFDGVNFEWQPLDVPKATLDQVPLDATGNRLPGAITSGSCLSWDNCWFFGSYGVVVHWDGNVLADASPDFTAQPWLRGSYTAAVARVDAAGHPFGFAVGTTGGSLKGQQLPPRADGTPPPELFGSTGGPFAPLPFSPPTVAQSGDPYRTDLVAVDFDSQGHGWVAGDPVGYRTGPAIGRPPSSDERRVQTAEPSPVLPISPTGTAAPCATPPGFKYANAPNGSDAYLWSSISVFAGDGDPLAVATMPRVGDGLAGGQIRPAAAGTTLNDDGSREPVLVSASCDRPPTRTRFRTPDPTAADQAHAPLVPADRLGAVTSGAANAVNDAWAATSAGRLLLPTDPTGLNGQPPERPHLYRLTDTRPPLAAAGDDVEPRPLVFQPDPPIFVEAPPPPPPPPPVTTVTQVGPTTTKKIKLKPAIYAVRVHVKTDRHGAVTLYLTFKVRRTVKIGVEALRGRKVVSSSGVMHFTGPRGRLALKLDRRRWPTRIRFISPRPGGVVASLSAPPAGGRRR
jgi:hypothetical protein